MIEINCEFCGKLFSKKPSKYRKSTHHYCSRSCSNRDQPRRKLEGMCSDCETTISSSRKRCAACNENFKASRRVDGSKNICQLCLKDFVVDRKRGDRGNKCRSCVTKLRKFKLKMKCLEYKGKECEVCGYNKCNRSLTFHHKDPASKSFSISQRAHEKGWETVRAELDKCLLLCANCHNETHYRMDSREWFKRASSYL